MSFSHAILRTLLTICTSWERPHSLSALFFFGLRLCLFLRARVLFRFPVPARAARSNGALQGVRLNGEMCMLIYVLAVCICSTALYWGRVATCGRGVRSRVFVSLHAAQLCGGELGGWLGAKPPLAHALDGQGVDATGAVLPHGAALTG